MKNKILLVIIGMILIFNLILISSQEEIIVLIETTDIGQELGFEENFITTDDPGGVEFEKTANGYTGTFKGADIVIEGNPFENIKSQRDAGLPSFIELDESGEITKAKFTVNAEGEGNYCFGNTCINAPANSRVTFSKELGVDVVVPDGSKLTNIPENLNQPGAENYVTTIRGKDIILPNGAVIDGRLNFENGYQTLLEGTKYTIDSGEGNLRTYTVSEITEYRTNSLCNGLVSCIQDSNGNVRVTARNGDLIGVNSQGNSIKKLEIDQIEDGSSVLFNNNGDVEMTFTKDPLTVKGNIKKLTTSVESSYKFGGEVHEQIFEPQVYGASFTQCSRCEVIGAAKGQIVLENILERYSTSIEDVKLTPGTLVTAAYRNPDNQEVYRTNDNEFFIYDAETNNLLYKKQGDSTVYQIQKGSIVPLSESQVGPITKNTINKEIIASYDGSIPIDCVQTSPKINQVIPNPGKLYVGQLLPIEDIDYDRKTLIVNGKTAKLIVQYRCPGCFDVRMPNGNLLQIRGNKIDKIEQ